MIDISCLKLTVYPFRIFYSYEVLIAGLGNMDPEYFGTRHNIGFEVLDQLAERLGVGFKVSSLAHVAEANYKGKKLILIKPSTYMNLSGKSNKVLVR